MAKPRKLLSAAEAAEMLGWSVAQVSDAMDSRQLPREWFLGAWWVPASYVEAVTGKRAPAAKELVSTPEQFR